MATRLGGVLAKMSGYAWECRQDAVAPSTAVADRPDATLKELQEALATKFILHPFALYLHVCPPS